MQRVAVIGAGTMGRVHAGAYAHMPGVELVAICDIREDAAQEVAKAHSAKAFTDVKKLLAEVDVDAIDICTPTHTHLDYIKAAAVAGKNVCCEKPLCRSTGQAFEAVRVCEDAGVTLFVAHVLRWFPEFRKLHDMIEQGTVGQPVMARTSRAGGMPRGCDGWYANAKHSGGVVLDLIIHDFDWLRWCFGKVKRVYARGLYEAATDGDYALVTLRFESGMIAHVEGSWMLPSGFNTSVEIAGAEGLLSFTNIDSAAVTIGLKSKEDAPAAVAVPESPISVNPYYLELAHFIECIETGADPAVSPDDGMEAVRIAEAALRSISTGRPVALA